MKKKTLTNEQLRIDKVEIEIGEPGTIVMSGKGQKRILCVDIFHDGAWHQYRQEVYLYPALHWRIWWGLKKIWRRICARF